MTYGRVIHRGWKKLAVIVSDDLRACWVTYGVFHKRRSSDTIFTTRQQESRVVTMQMTMALHHRGQVIHRRVPELAENVSDDLYSTRETSGFGSISCRMTYENGVG